MIVKEKTFEVQIRQQRDFRYTTEFIGVGGKILLRTGENPARYDLSGSEQYVRARVTDSGGAVAWVQPVFLKR